MCVYIYIYIHIYVYVILVSLHRFIFVTGRRKVDNSTYRRDGK